MTREEACGKLHFVAMNELGVHEVSGGVAEARILDYTAHTQLDAQSDEVPWCSSFANYVVDTAGFQGTGSAAAASWREWGVRLEQPILGCLVVWEHHVTFCDHPDVSNGIVRCLGGNQSDAVKVSRFPVGDAHYRSPL